MRFIFFLLCMFLFSCTAVHTVQRHLTFNPTPPTRQEKLEEVAVDMSLFVGGIALQADALDPYAYNVWEDRLGLSMTFGVFLVDAVTVLVLDN